jgi:hypothetical protein
MKRWLYAALFPAVLATSSAVAQKAPVPDPRLEPIYSRIVLAEIQRSVMFERTLPQPVLGQRALIEGLIPLVTEPDMVRVDDNLFIERSLLSPRPAPDDPGAVRIFRRDAR